MTEEYEILKVRDKTDQNHIEMGILFDLSFKIAICGKSQLSGKTTLILNLLLRDKFKYKNYFKGENIYIVSNNRLDNKISIMMEELEIPEGNLQEFDETSLNKLYEQLETEHMEEPDHLKKHKLIIFDDCGYSSGLKGTTNTVARLVCNGRHAMISQIYTAQKYSQLGTVIRSQITGLFLFSTSSKELELVEQDVNILENKKSFLQMVRQNTKERRDFIIVNFTNKYDEVYLNSKFKPISPGLS